jgi:YidC/Oxa1 family membrane protein insertase
VSIKMTVQPSTDPQQQSMNSMMQIMMPIMMAFLTMTMPSGLGIYWLLSQIITIIIQYFIYGWGGLFAKAPAPEAAAKPDGKSGSAKASSKGVDAEPAKKEAGSPASGIGGLFNRFKPKQGDKDKKGKAD